MKTESWQLSIPDATRIGLLNLPAFCNYCGSVESAMTACHGCGRMMVHRKGWSLAHFCAGCKIDLGKGE